MAHDDTSDSPAVSAGTGASSIAARAEQIEQLPIDQRASAYLAVYDELATKLESADVSEDA